ncbi:MAG: DNA-3-methyladenine glycosylase I [Clostridia bacterium]
MENRQRCSWVGSDPVYVAYHDTEWGVPIYDDQKLYEMFLLETFQAGLSWITILKKRAHFRAAFDQFNPEKIARYDADKVKALMQDVGIIRCRRKIEAAIKNAGIILEIQRAFGSFSAYLWGFSNHVSVVNIDDRFPTTTALSDRVSMDMKARGMRYVGSVTIYSYLQAVGIVNDHETGCFRYGR